MKKFENFCRALDNLAQGARYEPPYDTVVLTGLVALYEEIGRALCRERV